MTEELGRTGTIEENENWWLNLIKMSKEKRSKFNDNQTDRAILWQHVKMQKLEEENKKFAGQYAKDVLKIDKLEKQVKLLTEQVLQAEKDAGLARRYSGKRRRSW